MSSVDAWQGIWQPTMICLSRRYSGVIRSGNAYVPPGARKNAPPVAGASGKPAAQAVATNPAASTVVPPSKALEALKIAEKTKAATGTPSAPSVVVQAAPDMVKTASGAGGPEDAGKVVR